MKKSVSGFFSNLFKLSGKTKKHKSRRSRTRKNKKNKSIRKTRGG